MSNFIGIKYGNFLNARKGTKLRALTDLYGKHGRRIVIRKGDIVKVNRLFTEDDDITWFDVEPEGRLYHLYKFVRL